MKTAAYARGTACPLCIVCHDGCPLSPPVWSAMMGASGSLRCRRRGSPPPPSNWQLAGAAAERCRARDTRGEVRAASASGSRARGLDHTASKTCRRRVLWQRSPAADLRRQWWRRHTLPTAAPRGAAALSVYGVFSNAYFSYSVFGPWRRKRASDAWRPPPGGGARRRAPPPSRPSCPMAGSLPARTAHQGPHHVGTHGHRAGSLLWLVLRARLAHRVPPHPPALPRTPRVSRHSAARGRRLTPHCSSARWCCGGTARPSTRAAARPFRGAAPAPRRSPTTRPSRGARPTPR